MLLCGRFYFPCRKTSCFKIINTHRPYKSRAGRRMTDRSNAVLLAGNDRCKKNLVIFATELHQGMREVKSDESESPCPFRRLPS